MNEPQYINNVTFIGASPSTSSSQLNPGSSGVNFNETNAYVIIPFAPGVTPIVDTVSVPNTNTNVNGIIVVITSSNGTVLFTQASPSETNTVDVFPVETFPENSTVTITFQTTDGLPPQNVTISIIACYTPSTATTVVTAGSIPPTATGSTPSLTISSTTSEVTQSTGKR